MKIINKIIVIIIAVVGLYAAFFIASDIRTVYDKISNFKIEFLLIIIPLVTIGWFVLFARWHLLLKNSKIFIPKKDSLLIFFSGFALTIIPGKVGELIKSQLLKTKFDVSVFPVGVGPNTISVIVSTINGEPMSDVSGLKIKVSNPQRNISPIEISITESQSSNEVTEFEGEATFGFAGTWQIEIEAQRTQTANESVIFDVLVKPTLSEIRTEITEYDFPEADSAPLYPRYDGNNTIWISDAAEPRLWKFTLDDRQFSSYDFFGISTIFLDIDHDG